MKTMTVYAVLYLGSLVGLYTSLTDASIAAKALPQSNIVSCKLNSETDTGTQLLQNISTSGFTQ